MNNRDIRKNFGLRLKKLRISKGISQEKLGELADLHRTYISEVERGKRNISLDNIYILSKALGVTISQLLEGIDEDK
jgi:transcriptional regulator with XRE-family HTH domain